MHHLLLKPKNLVLIRHAESERNRGKKGVFYTEQERSKLGNTLNQDIALTAKGHKQAKAAGKVLKKKYSEFDIIINSGYLRTRQTMDGIISQFPKDSLATTTIMENSALRERDAGWAYLMTQDEVNNYFPWNTEVWNLGDKFFTRPPGGESLADTAIRLDVFFTQLAQLCEGKNVLLVAHGRAIVAMQSLLENWTHAHYKNIPPDLPNTGMITYHYSDKKKKLVRDK
ncbi:MAG: histidine phosphatase family protein [bacterium]